MEILEIAAKNNIKDIPQEVFGQERVERNIDWTIEIGSIIDVYKLPDIEDVRGMVRDSLQHHFEKRLEDNGYVLSQNGGAYEKFEGYYKYE